MEINAKFFGSFFVFIYLFFTTSCSISCSFPIVSNKLKEPEQQINGMEEDEKLSDTWNWLLSIGALRYGLSVEKINSILEENKDNYCGKRVELVPINSKEDEGLKKKKIIFHGKIFEGEYYIFREVSSTLTSPEWVTLIGVENRKASFALLRPWNVWKKQIVVYLPEDKEGLEEFNSFATEYIKKTNKKNYEAILRSFERDKENLKKMGEIENKIYQFLQRPKTKTEVKEYVKQLFAQYNVKGEWMIEEYPYHYYPFMEMTDYIDCFKKKNFKPDSFIAVDAVANLSYEVFFNSKKYSYEVENSLRGNYIKRRYDDYHIGIFECYYKDEKPIGVLMRKSITNFPFLPDEIYYGYLFWRGKKFQTTSYIYFPICVEDFNTKTFYGTLGEGYYFWTYE